MNSLKQHEIPGRVTLVTGQGELPFFRVETAWSTAEIYPHGAHLTRFQKKGEAPLLFMSAASEFVAGKAIRGGVPIIFPWFGGREGMPSHGFARQTVWDLVATRELSDRSVTLHFRLPPDDEFEVDFIVTIGAALTMELAVRNTGHSDFSFENCLHTYFQIGDIQRIAITGLQGARYLDHLLATEFTESGDRIHISAETDRTYQNTEATVEIHDPEMHRSISIRKSGSRSTVVWNPWIEKSKRMADFGGDEYLHMVCVESGNIAGNAVTLAPGTSAALKVEIDSIPLA